MRRQSRLALLVIALPLILGSISARAQVQPASPARRLITQTIDERNLITLPGNVRPEVNATNDRGLADDSLPIAHAQLLLQLPAEMQNWPKPPAITSAASTTFVAGTQGTFTVTATGTPAPTLAESRSLPNGVNFNATTGVLNGTPGRAPAACMTSPSPPATAWERELRRASS